MKRWKALRSLVVGDRKRSSTRAAERLVETHYATVYNLAYRTLGQRQDAEDITQQTFLRALPRVRELDGQDAAGWLCRVAANLCIDELRRGKRRHSGDQLVDDAQDELASPVAFGSPEGTLEQRELRLAVWRATLALPPQQRLALALREWHGMSYAQIASALATSVSAVETLLFRARQGFRRAYEQRQAQPAADDAGCAWCLERLSASVDGELSIAERRRVDAHVARCPTCRFAANELGTTSRLYAFLPLFVPALPAKAALLSAISGIGAAGAGAVLHAAGAGAVDVAASHASGGLTEIGSAATVAGAAGAAGSTGVSTAAASSAVGGAAGALGAAKSGVAVVAVAAAIGTAVLSGGQSDVPPPLADEAALVSQAPVALASFDMRPGLTSYASWTPPTAVPIENEATEADAVQPAKAEEMPAPHLMTIAQPSQIVDEPAPAAAPEGSDHQDRAEDSPGHEEQTAEPETSPAHREQSAEHEESPSARGETHDRVEEDNERPRSLLTTRLAQVADRSEKSEDEPAPAQRQVSTPAPAVVARPEQHQAERNEPREDNDAEDHPLPTAPQLTSAPRQVAPIRPRPTQTAAPKRPDDREPRQTHSERETPDSGD